MERCRHVALELLSLNGKQAKDITLRFVAERRAKANLLFCQRILPVHLPTYWKCRA
ncbi:MAG: hypothetical protein LBJ41_04550 [Treponema sp.]|nr:hypothetical protein [Treponema sp.]